MKCRSFKNSCSDQSSYYASLTQTLVPSFQETRNRICFSKTKFASEFNSEYRLIFCNIRFVCHCDIGECRNGLGAQITCITAKHCQQGTLVEEKRLAASEQFKRKFGNLNNLSHSCQTVGDFKILIFVLDR